MVSLSLILISCLLISTAARPQLERQDSESKEPEPKDSESKEPEKKKTTVTDLGKSANFNEFLDGILKEAGPAIKSHADPLNLPDTDSSLQRNFLNLNGGFQTFNGRLQGLSSLHRAGDAKLETDADQVPTLTATLAINNLNVGTDARAWLGGINIPFYMAAKVKYLKGTLEFKIPQGEGDKPRASKLVIDEIGEVTLDFERLGPLNFVLEKVGYVFLNALKGTLKDRISAPIMNAINQNIDKATLSLF